MNSYHSLPYMNSYVMNSYLNTNIWIHIIRCFHRSYEFKFFANDMNSYSSSMIWIHIQLYHMKAMSIPENRMVTSINNLLRLTSDLNSWSSKMVISHGGQSLDISSAAQGALSSTPIGIFPLQNFPYPGTKYCFDENIFFGYDAKDLLVNFFDSRIHRHFLVLLQKNFRRVLRKQRLP